MKSLTFHRAIVTFHHAAPRVDIAQLCCRSSRQSLHRSRIRAHLISVKLAIYRRVSLSEDSFFRRLFLRFHFRLHAHADLCFSFHCPNGCSSYLLFKSRIFRGNAFTCFHNEYPIRHVSLGEIVTPRICNIVFAARRVQRIHALIASG